MKKTTVDVHKKRKLRSMRYIAERETGIIIDYGISASELKSIESFH